jgi:hypothetical protein
MERVKASSGIRHCGRLDAAWNAGKSHWVMDRSRQNQAASSSKGTSRDNNPIAYILL